MEATNPYEYVDGVLGVLVCYLVDGEHAAEGSVRVVSERGLQLRVSRYERATGREVRLRRSGRHAPSVVRWDWLPSGWQRALRKVWGSPAASPAAGVSLLGQEYRRSARYFDELCALGGLSDDKIDELTVNASMLAAMGRASARRRALRKQFGQADKSAEWSGSWESVCAEMEQLRAATGCTLGSSPKRLRAKLAELQRDGARALVHKGVGNQRTRKVTGEVELLLNRLFSDAKTKPTKEDVVRRYSSWLAGEVEVVNVETGELYARDAFPELSTSTIVGYLSRWRNEVATYGARSGNRQEWMRQFRPYHSLKVDMAGSIISVDDRQPPFEYAKGKRVWFYNGIDLGSEAWTVWVWGESKAGIIEDFYRQMVRNYAEWGVNLPAELEAELSLNGQYRDTFLKEGEMFEYVHIEANNARAKRIERYFGSLRYGPEKERAGWLGRPFARREANQQGPGEVAVVAMEEIVSGCLRDIEAWNNSPHSRIAGKTRWEVFLAMQHPKVRPTNYRGIIPHLGYVTKTSVKAGIVRVNNGLCLLGIGGKVALGDDLIGLLDKVEGRDVEVRWLDGNDGRLLKAYVYVGDVLVCEAVEKPVSHRARIERDGDDAANLALMSAYDATILGYGRRRRAEIGRAAITPSGSPKCGERAGVRFRIGPPSCRRKPPKWGSWARMTW